MNENEDNNGSNHVGYCGLTQDSTVLTSISQMGKHISLCGHAVHNNCHALYLETIDRNGARAMDGSHNQLDKGQFNCPTCKRLSNVLVPHEPGVRSFCYETVDDDDDDDADNETLAEFKTRMGGSVHKINTGSSGGGIKRTLSPSATFPARTRANSRAEAEAEAEAEADESENNINNMEDMSISSLDLEDVEREKKSPFERLVDAVGAGGALPNERTILDMLTYSIVAEGREVKVSERKMYASHYETNFIPPSACCETIRAASTAF